MRQMFEEDPDRFNKFSLEMLKGSLFLDYSKVSSSLLIISWAHVDSFALGQFPNYI